MSKYHMHNFPCVAILVQNAQIRQRHCIVVFTLPLTPMQKGRVPMLKYFKHLRLCRRKRIKNRRRLFMRRTSLPKRGAHGQLRKI